MQTFINALHLIFLIDVAIMEYLVYGVDTKYVDTQIPIQNFRSIQNN